MEARIREETLSRETAKAQPCVEVKESCCPCCEVAKAAGMCCLDHLLCLPPKDFENGYIMFGFSPQGIHGHCLSKYAGMNIFIQYHNGLPLIWVKHDPNSTVTTNE